MAEAKGKDLAWKPIAMCVGSGLAGIAIGAFLVAPFLKKLKDKKASKSSEGSK